MFEFCFGFSYFFFLAAILKDLIDSQDCISKKPKNIASYAFLINSFFGFLLAIKIMFFDLPVWLLGLKMQ
jgi:hypothetical protein